MDKIPTDISTNASSTSTTTDTEARSLRDVVYSSKRSGGAKYGSLSKSQTQPIFYVTHKIESDDTFQRLALKYCINVCIFFFFLSSLFILF
jgi:LysM repeat protein